VPPQAVRGDDVERVVQAASARGRAARSKLGKAAMPPSRIAEIGLTKPAAGVDGDQAHDRGPWPRPRRWLAPVRKRSSNVPDDEALAVGANIVFTKARAAGPLAPSALAGIEPEPAEPQQPRRRAAKNGTLLRQDRPGRAKSLRGPRTSARDERRGTRVDVDDGAAGEIQGPEPPEETRPPPDPVRHGRVDDQTPTA